MSVSPADLMSSRKQGQRHPFVSNALVSKECGPVFLCLSTHRLMKPLLLYIDVIAFRVDLAWFFSSNCYSSKAPYICACPNACVFRDAEFKHGEVRVRRRVCVILNEQLDPYAVSKATFKLNSFIQTNIFFTSIIYYLQ